jgi:hypothetical protein
MPTKTKRSPIASRTISQETRSRSGSMRKNSGLDIRLSSISKRRSRRRRTSSSSGRRGHPARDGSMRSGMRHGISKRTSSPARSIKSLFLPFCSILSGVSSPVRIRRVLKIFSWLSRRKENRDGKRVLCSQRTLFIWISLAARIEYSMLLALEV